MKLKLKNELMLQSVDIAIIDIRCVWMKKNICYCERWIFFQCINTRNL